MPLPRQSAITFRINGPIARDDLAGLCSRVCTLLDRSGAGDVYCDVRDVNADAVTVDALARLQLAAHRRACQVRLRGASDDLRELVALMGLQHVLTD
ncbi:MAG: STAS domain-containing protein [Chloroflexi bacterium]|nr:MAG: STAS domain-containing protein [Chloroflexota bacterium]